MLSISLIALIAPLGGKKALIVRSGSMQPAIGVGDLVIVQPRELIRTPQKLIINQYSIGDVIAFKSEKNPKNITTHRVESVEIQKNQILYSTKGDANKAPDQNLVKEENIIGKGTFLLPGIGKILALAKTQKGFISFIIFPAGLVIVLELLNIFRELKKNRTNKSAPAFFGTMPMGGVRIIAPLFIGALFFQSTAAFFSDVETSTGNTFQAAESFPHIVINEVMFNPDNPFCSGGEPASEWVEIYNPTPNNVNLDGWTIHDNSTQSDTLSNVTLNSESFVIITNCSESEFNAIWPLPADTLFIDLGSSIGNGLANGGDEIKLTDNSSHTIDHVSYGTNKAAFNPSVLAPVSNHTIEREPNGIDTDSATDFVDRETATPGS